MNLFRIGDSVFNLGTIAYIDFRGPRIAFFYNDFHRYDLTEKESEELRAMSVLPPSAVRVGDVAINLDKVAYVDLSKYGPRRKVKRIRITFVGLVKGGFDLPRDLEDGDADQFYQYIQNYYPGR